MDTIVLRAKQNVIGFTISYCKFFERVSIDQKSRILIINMEDVLPSLNYTSIDFHMKSVWMRSIVTYTG